MDFIKTIDGKKYLCTDVAGIGDYIVNTTTNTIHEISSLHGAFYGCDQYVMENGKQVDRGAQKVIPKATAVKLIGEIDPALFYYSSIKDAAIFGGYYELPNGYYSVPAPSTSITYTNNQKKLTTTTAGFKYVLEQLKEVNFNGTFLSVAVFQCGNCQEVYAMQVANHNHCPNCGYEFTDTENHY